MDYRMIRANRQFRQGRSVMSIMSAKSSVSWSYRQQVPERDDGGRNKHDCCYELFGLGRKHTSSDRIIQMNWSDLLMPWSCGLPHLVFIVDSHSNTLHPHKCDARPTSHDSCSKIVLGEIPQKGCTFSANFGAANFTHFFCLLYARFQFNLF